MPLSITAIPALETNYVWALHNARHAVLVDPGEAGAPLDWLAERRLALAAVLVTHHHYDHTDGISAIVERDRKSTRLNSSHVAISYAVFCLKKTTRTTTRANSS